MKRFYPLILLACILVSCRSLVVEERRDCPSFLFFDIANHGRLDSYYRVRIADFTYPENDFLVADTTVVGRIQDKSFYMKVPKSDAVQGFGIAGFDGALIRSGSEVVVDDGKDFVPLFRFQFRTPAREEQVLIPVELSKDYCALTLSFTQTDSFSAPPGLFPFYLIIRSNTVGIDGLSGIPVRGDFCYRPPEEQEGVFRALIPRQADRSLTLEIWAKEGMYVEEGMVSSYNLWNFIQENYEGFSWEAKDLPDLYIEIDFTESKLAVTVQPWISEGGIHYDA